jgi:aspartate/methionine/tyrosine aminotransferase
MTEFRELIEAEAEKTARSFAGQLHQMISEQITEGMAEALAEAQEEGLDPGDEGDPVLIPAIRWKTHAHLADLNREAARGWRQVFEAGLEDS